MIALFILLPPAVFIFTWINVGFFRSPRDYFVKSPYKLIETRFQLAWGAARAAIIIELFIFLAISK